MEKPLFRAGDIIKYENDGSLYEVEGSNPLYFYRLKYLSFDTHGHCILRTAGTKIDYVDKHFRKLTKLEKALK